MVRTSNCEKGKKLQVSSNFGRFEINIFQHDLNQKSLCIEHMAETISITIIIINGFDILRQEILFCFFR
jgi:hypothetical protein